jgi:hypothetical protein
MSQSDVRISLRDACYVDFNPAEWPAPDLSMSETIPCGIGSLMNNEKRPVRWNEEAMSHFKRDRDLRPEGGNWVFHFENDRMYIYSDLSGDWRYIVPFFRDERSYFYDQVIVNRSPQQILPDHFTYSESVEPIVLLNQLIPAGVSNLNTVDMGIFGSEFGNKQMPDENRTIPMDLVYSAQDWEVIKTGSHVGGMENKWDIEFTDGQLYFYRSWTGYCNFIVQPEEFSDGVRLINATINCDPEQLDDAADDVWREEIRLVIDHVLLGKPIDLGDGDPDDDAVQRKLLGTIALLGTSVVFGEDKGGDYDDDEAGGLIH